MRLPKRAVALFIGSVMIPILIILQLYSDYSKDVIENELSNNMQLAVNQIKSNLDYRFEQIRESSLAILSTAYPYIRSGSTDVEEQLNEYKELKLLVSAYEGKHMISKIRLYVPGDKIYANQQDTFYSLPDIQQLQNGEAGFYFQRGVHWIETYGARIYESGGLTNVISCRMTISSRTNYEEIASVLQLDIEENKLSRIYSAGIAANEEIYLVNINGTIISHANDSRIGKKGLSPSELSVVLDQQAGHLSGNRSENEDLVAFAKLDAMDWYLVMRIPHTAVAGSDMLTFDMSRMLLILAILVILAIALIWIYSSIIEKTVKRINAAVVQLNNDGIEKVGSLFSQDTASKDPLAVFEHNANNLVVTVKELLEDYYEAEIKAKDYHLKALQAQINPHFLYNTLDSIKWMILEGETDDSVWMLNAISKYFRLSLSKGRDIVTLAEEINLVRSYLGIMQKRYKNRFTVDYVVDESLNDCLIPKLSLQPLAENALQHGIMHSSNGQGHLKITVWRQEERMNIVIEDNGCGMTEEQVSNIMNNLHLNTEGYGLSNVDERLRLFGGEDCGLYITSILHKGTAIKISLPMKYSS
jgi:two-component system sensor histidine kinase YesM